MEPTLANLDHPQHRHRVQKQAAHGRAMEEEVRTI
jgi:plasmid stability protein